MELLIILITNDKKYSIGAIVQLLCCTLFGFSSMVLAELKPQWELGVGVGSIIQPDYLGADESSSYTTLYPFGIYRQPKYSIDRNGVNGSLLEVGNFGVGLSFGAQLPVDSDDNQTRRGMPDLEPQLEFGPNMHYLLSERGSSSVKIELPVRMSISVRNGDYEGVTANPRLVWRFKSAAWKNNISIGSVFSEQRYSQRIYSVEQPFERVGRNRFAAKGGYSGSKLSFAGSRRYDNVLVAAFFSYSNLDGAVNKRSPLLKRRHNYSAGVAITWLFKESSKLVDSI